MPPIKSIISTFFSMVLLLTSVAQYHHHDCSGNVFLTLTDHDDSELAIGSTHHCVDLCSDTAHNVDPKSHHRHHHHEDSESGCSLHLNDVIECKLSLSSEPTGRQLDFQLSPAILPSYPLLFQSVSYVFSILQGNKDILRPIRTITGPLSRRGPPRMA